MKKLFIIFILSFLPIHSFSQEDFKYATSSKDGTDYYIKIVEKDSEYGLLPLKVWVKNTNKTKTFKNKKGKLVTTGGGYTLVLMEISCRSKTYIIKQSVTYNNAGNVTESDDNYSPISKEIVPGSVMEGIFDSACSE